MAPDVSDLRGSGDDPRVWGGIAERVFGHLRERGRLLNRIRAR